jgi:hypothetical protein
MSDHPDDHALVSWLESGKPARVGRHLEDGCDSCLDRLDTLSDLGDVRGGLAEVSAPPDDLHRRTTGGLQGRLAAEEALVAFVDLFTIPWRTASVLLGDRDRPVIDADPVTGHDSDDDGELTDE